MSLKIELLKERVRQSWNNTASEYPRWGTSYSIEQQIQKEAKVDQLMESADASMRTMEGNPINTKRKLLSVRSRIQKAIVQLLHSFECVIDNEMEKSFSDVTDDFIRRAYDFDPSITEDAVYQASRNVLIMNTFQMHLGKEVALTPSVFAYSMLYPYTDNYLDAVDIDPEVKRYANIRLGQRLSGVHPSPRNHHERMIDKLVEMIEREFDRRECPLVYESLLAIHNAQHRSLAQQSPDNQCSPALLLDISIEKGGTSVVADGYLVAGTLTTEEEEFIFNFGVVLQLIDDLQDIEEDRAHQHHTLAGTAAELGLLDIFTDRLLVYMNEVLGSTSSEQEKARLLMESGCRLLIMESVAINSSYYSEGYLYRKEQYSPVRFGYLRDVRKRLQKQHNARQTEQQRAYSETTNFVKRQVLEFMR